jgi:hypothetical protein
MNDRYKIILMLVIIFALAYFMKFGYIEHLTLDPLTDTVSKNVYLMTFINQVPYYIMGVDAYKCGFTNDNSAFPVNQGTSIFTVYPANIKFILMTREEMEGELKVANSVPPLSDELINPRFRIDRIGYDKNYDGVLNLLGLGENNYAISYIYGTIRPIGFKDGEMMCIPLNKLSALVQIGKNTTGIDFNCSFESFGGNDGSMYLKIGNKYIGYSDEKCGKYMIIKTYDDINDKVLKIQSTENLIIGEKKN